MTKIYTIETKTKTYSHDNYRVRQEKPTLRIFDKADKLGEEIYQEVIHCFDIYDYHYNDLGDEWKVEPSYEMGCRYYDTLRSKEFKELISAYSIDCCPLPELNLDDWHNGHQEAAQDILPDTKAYYDDVMTQIKERLPTSGFTIVASHRNATQTYTLKIVDLDNEFFNAPKVIVNETTQDVSAKEQEAYYNSEQYETDCKENAERQREINTFMGESGYHNYSDDGETIRMW